MLEPIPNNALTGAFEELWKALEDNQTFCALVPNENRHKYPVLYEPNEPDTLSQSATPHVVAVLSDFQMNPHATSSSSLPTMTFDIRIETAYQRTGVAFDVAWAILIALFAWHKRITAATSAAFPYIRCVRLLNGANELKAEKGIKGWFSLLKVEIGLNLKTTDLENAS